MRTDTEVKMTGLEVLNHHLGLVDAERFIALIQREPFDYTKWLENLFPGVNGREISRQAMEMQDRMDYKE